MIGHDRTWLPEALKLLRDELPNIHVVISTQNSPQLATALLHGGIDLAFLRREDGGNELKFRTLVEESFEVFYLPIIPSRRRPQSMSKTLSAKHSSAFLEQLSASQENSRHCDEPSTNIDKDNGIEIRPSHEVDNLAGATSLIPSTRGLCSASLRKDLLPAPSPFSFRYRLDRPIGRLS